VRIRLAPLLAAMPFLFSCGAATPDGYPVVKGAYGGSRMYETHVTDLGSGLESTGVPCSGSLVIADQQGQSLTGTWLRGVPCVANRGSFAGTVAKAGAVTLDFQNALGFQTFDGCAYVSGDRTWSGAVANGTLTVRIDVVLDCASARDHIVQTLTAPMVDLAM
jgi:hypothetical protein